MIDICTHIKERKRIEVYANGYDPTRTTTLRNAFAREMRVRFNELQRVIYKAVVEDDVFNIAEKSDRGLTEYQLTTPGKKRFKFRTSEQKVKEFMNWLNRQTDAGVLKIESGQRIGSSLNPAWSDRYITDSYKRGVQRARYEMNKAGFNTPTIEATGGIDAAMSGPFHADRLGILYARVFNDLEGITKAMDTQISRILTDGIAQGDNPRLLARKLVATINGKGVDKLGLRDKLGRFISAKRRAEILARTEIVRAHHQATIQEYRNWGVQGVKVQAEWITAEDNRVCDRCQSMAGNGPLPGGAYTLDQIEPLIPFHPQCRCMALPFKGKEE